MTNPLPPLKYGKIVGRFLGGISDSPDVDALPDFPPLKGIIRFDANVDKYLVQLAEPPATVVPLDGDHVVVTLDSEGFITWRGELGLFLPAPVAGTMNPSGWTYRVTFELTYLDEPVPIAAFNINVPEYIPGPDPENPDEGSVGLVDLTVVSPVPSSAGNAVVRGVSVDSVEMDGNDLVFGLDDGSFLPGVTVPQIEEATDAAAAAAASAAAAAASETAAEAAVNSFDLTIGTVTEGAADATVSGGPPAWTLDLVLPPGPAGPAAPDADATTKGILRLTGDLGGTATTPTVPGLATKVPTTRTISTTAPLTGGGDLSADRTFAVSDATTGAKGVVQLAGVLAGSAASPAFNAAAFGTSSSTACVGNDARLADTRTPTAGTSPYDASIVGFGKDTTRATGTGDFAFGVKLPRAATFTSVTYRASTADASGNLVVELRKNGSTVSGSSATIAAANQVAGGTATGTFSFAAGDILTVYITAVGTTPGKGLIADILGTA